MKDLGLGEPSACQASHLSPTPVPPLLTPFPEDAEPEALDLGTESRQAGDVAGDRVVIEPPLDHGTKPSASLLNRPVHASFQLRFDLLQLRPHTLGDRFAFEGERSLPGRAATVRKAQKVERLRPALPPFLTSFRRVAAEFDQTGFVRMKLKAE